MLLIVKGHVVFGAQVISPNQQIIEKTKYFSTRANAISLSIDKKLKNIESVGYIFLFFF